MDPLARHRSGSRRSGVFVVLVRGPRLHSLPSARRTSSPHDRKNTDEIHPLDGPMLSLALATALALGATPAASQAPDEGKTLLEACATAVQGNREKEAKEAPGGCD